MTDYLLISFSDLRGHTQQCRAALQQKLKQTDPKLISSPINYPDYLKPKKSFQNQNEFQPIVHSTDAMQFCVIYCTLKRQTDNYPAGEGKCFFLKSVSVI